MTYMYDGRLPGIGATTAGEWISSDWPGIANPPWRPWRCETGSEQERREQKWEAQEMKERFNKATSRANAEVGTKRLEDGGVKGKEHMRDGGVAD
jgi:hypothetical protein